MSGSLLLFQIAGTKVYVHISWFIAAYFLLQDRPVPYSSFGWDIAEYVAGFGLVLLHELGHVFACRQTGGVADRVVLWPLGGLAFVAPPPRPSAELWTTVAGPLVNLLFVPILVPLTFLLTPETDVEPPSDLAQFVWALAWFNGVMLVFNLLPIFPLDGGRILQSLLWCLMSRPAALAVAAGIGVVGAAGLGILAIAVGAWWLGFIAVFLLLGAFGGISQANQLAQMQHAERRTAWACPNCGKSPPVGKFWRCGHCFGSFDLFNPSRCPKSHSHASDISCPECNRHLTAAEWVTTDANPEKPHLDSSP
jgi:Zn-dependent protease